MQARAFGWAARADFEDDQTTSVLWCVNGLERFRMLDLSRLLPGPFCSHVLADLGMEVIKVEEPELRGGMGRDVMSPRVPDPELEKQHAAFNSLARNKKRILLNLKFPEAREVFYRLAKTADVVLGGYRPGVTQRLGVDHETLAAIDPRLVYGVESDISWTYSRPAALLCRPAGHQAWRSRPG